MDSEKIIKAGKIASETKEYARTIVKKGVPLIDLAEKIEAHIVKLGGKPAFPTTFGINEITAHATPTQDDKTLTHGLIKVDFGVHIDGWIADTAFSVDLENNKENQKLIKAAEEALENALKIVKKNVSLDEIGGTISKTIESHGFSPVINLSGHSIERYDLHSGITVPNVNFKENGELVPGLYAIEPFATTGSGKVHDGKPSGIYALTDEKNPRSPMARRVLDFIKKEYNTLPFCSRWIVKALGPTSLFGLRELETNGNLHSFHQLVEAQGAKVSQAEHTILIEKDKVTVTTL